MPVERAPREGCTGPRPAPVRALPWSSVLWLLLALSVPVSAQEPEAQAEKIEQQAQELAEEIREQAQELAEEIQDQAEELRSEAEELQEQLRDELEEIDEELGREQAIDEVFEERRGRRDRRRRSSDKVAIGSTVRVESNEVVGDVVAVLGGLKIDGEVDGDAVAILGSAKINGRVVRDLVVVLGNIELGSEAEILGAVTCVGGRVEREAGATVVGDVSEVAFSPDLDLGDWDWWGDWGGWGDWDDWDDDWGSLHFFDFLSFLGSLFWHTSIILLCSLVLLVAPRGVSRIEARLKADFWMCLLVGVAVVVLGSLVLIPVGFCLVLSCIGIPFLLLLPVPVLLGYTGAALAVGRVVNERFSLKQGPFLILLIGAATIQACGLFGDLLAVGGGFLWPFAVMFFLVGLLAATVAVTVGLGAVFLTRFGRVGPGAETAELPPVPPALPGGSAGESTGADVGEDGGSASAEEKRDIAEDGAVKEKDDRD